MLQLKELPETCLCQSCKKEVSKNQLSIMGLKWDKLICNQCERELGKRLDTEIAEGITYGDYFIMLTLQMLDRINKN